MVPPKQRIYSGSRVDGTIAESVVYMDLHLSKASWSASASTVFIAKETSMKLTDSVSAETPSACLLSSRSFPSNPAKQGRLRSPGCCPGGMARFCSSVP